MRWGRGLFRLWIVGTIVWFGVAPNVTGFAPIAGQAIDYYWSHPALVANRSDDVSKVCPEKPGDASGYFDCLERIISPAQARANDQYYFAKTMRFLAISLGVPVFVLFLSVVVRWIVSGFRGPPAV